MKNLWIDSEGDNWFARNKKQLGRGLDIPLYLLKLYSIKPKKVLEIGAADGYRLSKIYSRYGSKVTAIEPSYKAVEAGKKKYRSVKFIQNILERYELKESFDLIIVNFVFHWVYRENLYTCVQKIDTALKDGGYLIIGDFGTGYFLKNKYHHLTRSDFYTWKMQYWNLFSESGRYLELAKLRFNHDTHKISPEINIDNMGTTVLLRKQDLYIPR